MSGPPTNVPFQIINTSFGLPVYLHLSDSDDKSIVVSGLIPTTLRQSWIVRSKGGGICTLESSYNGQSIGFEGSLTQGPNLVADDPSVAKRFVFQKRPGQNNYTILLHTLPFAITMSNPVPGSQVQLFRQNGLGNQIWHLQEAPDL